MKRALYYPNWVNSTLKDWSPYNGIDVLYYAFCEWSEDGSVNGENPETIKTFVEAAKNGLRRVQVILSFGGYGANMTGFKNNPEAAAGSAAWLCQQAGADGIDLDYEYPSQGDTELYTKFVTTYRAAFPTGVLTAAVSVDPLNFPKGMSGKFDWLNIMTYDYAGSWVSKTCHDTSLKNAKKAVQDWINAGYMPMELAVGVPFYGKQIECTIGTGSNGLGAIPAASGWWQTMTFEQITDMSDDNKIFWDTVECAPYKYNATTRMFTTYSDKYQIQWFKDFARARGLSGVFAWCAGQDNEDYTLTNSLMNSVATPGLSS